MKTHAIASAVLLAACVAPRAERVESAPEEEPPEENRAQTRTACTPAHPCTLEVVEIARRRADLEAATESKMALAGDSAQTKRVAEGWMQSLGRSIADERTRFSDWCERTQAASAAKRRSGAPGLTPDDLLAMTGKPTQQMKPEPSEASAEAGVDTRVWTWEVPAPLSGSVTFAILLMRPAGTDAPFVFGGCQWCASGGPVTSKGCVMLPVKKP
jgi:hypothetical protein